MAADCSGLIVYALRKLGAFTSNQDMGSGSLRNILKNRGKFKDMPDIPGLIVWRTGHIAIYVGEGKIVEAKGTDYGVVYSNAKTANFTEYGYLPYFEYEKQADNYAAQCTGNDVNIRDKPNGISLGKANKGDKMRVIKHEGDWALVEIEVKTKISGYMFRQYIEED